MKALKKILNSIMVLEEENVINRKYQMKGFTYQTVNASGTQDAFILLRLIPPFSSFKDQSKTLLELDGNESFRVVEPTTKPPELCA